MGGSTYVNDLLSGTHWQVAPTGNTQLNYAFWQQTPSYDTYPPENNGFMPFTNSMQLAVINNAFDVNAPIGPANMPGVLNYIESFTNISFSVQPVVAGDINSESQVQIGYGMAFIDPSAEAYTYYPTLHNNDPTGGDVWANETYFTSLPDGTPDPTAAHVVPGNYDWLALWHETGHALGLKHPFERPHTLPSDLESDQYSIMSYTHSSHYVDGIYPETFMPLDIAAIQSIYGVNTNFHNGNDNYVLRPDEIYTIWDTGGTDLFDGSAQSTDEVIDLREGHYSTVNSATTMTDNIAIAYGVTIENATGGSGNDTFYDNAVTNVINTGDGNNTVWLTTGDDTVIGGTGNDTIHMGLGSESVDGGAGTDTLIFNTSESNLLFNNAAGTATIHGYTYTFVNDEVFKFTDGTFNGLAGQNISGAGILKGGLGDDTITGTGAGTHVLFGFAGDDVMSGPAGSMMVMYGGSGNDTYMVDNSKDICQDLINNPAGGIDTVMSDVNYVLGIGIDNLTVTAAANTSLTGKGNTLDNIMVGGASNDTLFGYGGNDTLEGGGGVNTLTGGVGADTFLFHNSDLAGTDVITDFSIKTGDKIDISNVLTGYNPANPLDSIHLTISGVSTVLSVDTTGAGTSYTNIATLQHFQDTDVQSLINSGNLIA